MAATSKAANRISDTVWQLISDGVSNPSSDAHWPMFATTDHADPASPNVRTVVLRAASETAHWLQIHSDDTGALVADLRANPNAMIAFYDKQTRCQVRAKGEVSIYNQTDLAALCWDNLSTRQRQDYTGPGSFTVLRLVVSTIDFLDLSQSIEQTARLDYRVDPMTISSPKP
ncbi:MAG: pyridoxamine 5'-phosphate oxidase family protein [Burkholderiaceae bacterium]